MKKQKGVIVAETAFVVLMGALLFGGGMTAYNEPHYSLRDGCNMRNVAMTDGSGNRMDSCAHCKDLPRVYSGKAWVPVTSKPNPPRA